MQTIFPVLRYRDAHAAIDWLCTAFGFERQAVYDGDGGFVEHAQLRHRSGLVLLSSERPSDEECGFGLHAGQGWLSSSSKTPTPTTRTPRRPGPRS